MKPGSENRLTVFVFVFLAALFAAFIAAEVLRRAQ